MKKKKENADSFQTVPSSKNNKTVRLGNNTNFHNAIFNRYEIIARGARRPPDHEAERTKALEVFKVTHQKSLEMGRKHRKIREPLKLNSDDNGVIYALVDEKGSVRYVGQTSNSAAQRELSHWYSRHSKKTTIAKLIKKRGSPLFAAALEKVNISDSLVKEVFHTAAHPPKHFGLTTLIHKPICFDSLTKITLANLLGKKKIKLNVELMKNVYLRSLKDGIIWKVTKS